ncbi:MAG: hypothetical protein L3J41_14090 [Melioribacteraceae bacterium]|nr:hypothetical protein [Melioribacteraceae bacterium]
MSQGRTGKINYRCPICLLREIDYDLLFEKEVEQFYCRRCNWEGEEQEILHLYSIYKQKYKAMLKRFTVEDILKDDFDGK